MVDCLDVEAPHDPTFQQDLEMLVGSGLLTRIPEDSTVVITGATGLIGSMAVKSILCHNRLRGTAIRVVALTRNAARTRATLGHLMSRPHLSVYSADLADSRTDLTRIIEGPVDYIIHGASPTSSAFFLNFPAETIQAALRGTEAALLLASERRARRMVYLSSMEVFGVTSSGLEPVSEEDLGYIDVLDPRSSYPESKRMAECMCASYGKEFGVPVVIARLSRTFGPGVSLVDDRIFAQFARAVIHGKDLVLHTDGASLGNYCYIRDSVAGLFTLLSRGEDGHAYTVVNEESTMTIKEMAELVAGEVAGGQIGVSFDAQDPRDFGYAPPTTMRLTSAKLRRLGWKPEVGLRESYERMISSMKDSAG